MKTFLIIFINKFKKSFVSNKSIMSFRISDTSYRPPEPEAEPEAEPEPEPEPISSRSGKKKKGESESKESLIVDSIAPARVNQRSGGFQMRYDSTNNPDYF
jgi:hypothetical protein